jgi:hypothetical protein
MSVEDCRNKSWGLALNPPTFVDERFLHSKEISEEKRKPRIAG